MPPPNMRAKRERLRMEFDEMCERAYDIHARYRAVQLSEAGHTWSPAETMLGFVGDVGDLAKLIMKDQGLRASNEDVEALVAHELSDCLWSVIVIARQMNIDLERAFLQTMGELQSRLDESPHD
jgi:Predicted pyrophosphatase